MYTVKRIKHNPILKPDKNNSFESFVVFNPSPIEVGNNIHLVYRAQSHPEHFEGHDFSLSVIGRAVSKDGVNFKNRQKFIVPEYPWERFGCEDPRVTKIGGKYYIFYTALSAFPLNIPGGIKIGLAISEDMKTVSEKHLVTNFNSKAMTLFPEKINGKYVALLTVNPDILPTHITIAEFNKIEDMWNQKYWDKFQKDLDKHIFIRGDQKDRIEIGSTPIKTKDGWLVICCRIIDHASPERVFAIEAFLLDLKNPKNIIGKTRTPLLVPEESYEKYGQLPEIIFPSGAIIKKDKLLIYYGGADTVCAVAEVSLASLLKSMKLPHKEDGFIRLSEKPIILPKNENAWEKRAVFNPAVVDIDGEISILYRAMSEDNTSTIGIAETEDGVNISFRGKDPIYTPRGDLEAKFVPNGNSGCEDPRLTMIGTKIYMYYTAYNGVNPPAIAMSSISVKDFKNKNWKWSDPVLVTPLGVDDKDGCLHPEKIKGKYFLYHRTNNRIVGDFGDTPEFRDNKMFRNIPILSPRKGMWDSKKVGISAPPIKTKDGWLLLYHGVSDEGIYRAGFALLDLKDPTKVLGRMTDYVLEPIMDYEKNGEIPNVVFPCGAVLRKGEIIIYYGGADKVVNVASVKLKDVLDAL